MKIYAYVDETGQDTGGDFFLVAVVVLVANREELRKDLQEIERQSGRRKRKWAKSNNQERQKYIELLLNNKKFKNNLFYSAHRGSGEFAKLTILTTALAINERVAGDYKATIVIDGLDSSLYPRYAAGLRGLRIKTRKVRGIRDEADEFIRLADSVAGFVRDYLDGIEWTKDFYEKAIAEEFIKETK